ncbi:IS3 family transposase [Brevibacterium sp. JNUCC-42]|nr:IS3 family transposase [Brevibacterium sp. JNUCC-42]
MDIHERFKNKKRELIQGATFQTPEQARKEIFKYIELYYNTKRIHSSLDYLSPIEFEKVYSLYSPNLVSVNVDKSKPRCLNNLGQSSPRKDGNYLTLTP